MWSHSSSPSVTPGGSIAGVDDFDLAAFQVVAGADDFQAAVRDAFLKQRRTLQDFHLVGYVQIDRAGFEVVATLAPRLLDRRADVGEDFGHSVRGLADALGERPFDRAAALVT